MAVAQVLKVADKGFYYTLFDFPFILFLWNRERRRCLIY